MPELIDAARDAAYAAIGFGVLSFQRAQVRRRELERRLEERRRDLGQRAEQARARVAEASKDLGRLARVVDQASEPVVRRVEERLDQVEAVLPPPARILVHQARAQAEDLLAQLRERLGPAA
jgi:pantothenate kinase